MNRIFKIIKNSFFVSTSILTFFLIFISDELILKKEKDIKIEWLKWIHTKSDDIKPLLYKLVCFLIIFVLLALINFLYYYVIRRKVKVKGKDYNIEIRYGDIFKCKNCLPVVNSDECFSSNVGVNPGDIKKKSVFGQYLLLHKDLNINTLINSNKIKHEKAHSKYNNKICYKPGTVLNNKDALIVAFARLDEDGNAFFNSLEDYFNCLLFMWKQIKPYGDKDIVIPVLGSGRTTIKGVSLTKQEILDYFIMSYMLSCNKKQRDNRLIICCNKKDISLDKIKCL